jgi:osmotically-inducible protein OsmY
MASQQLTLQDRIAAPDPVRRLGGHVTAPARGDAQQCPAHTEASHVEDLALTVHRALIAADSGRLRPVSVKVHHGRVYLYGRVHTFYAKQIAQHTAMSVAGVEHVSNELIVE